MNFSSSNLSSQNSKRKWSWKFLNGALALGIALTMNACAQTTLKDAFKNHFLVGAALNESQYCGSNSVEADIVKTQFNSISPENVLKWENIHPEPDEFDFSMADRYVDFGVKNKMFIIGHNLIWHSQTPKWVFCDTNGNYVDRDTLLQRMHEHIFTIVSRYKGKISGWDVVNEALNENGTLRDSPWRKIIGDDYIAKAFEFAHEADPQAELYYNEFALEDAPKRNGAIMLMTNLQAQGVPISGIGLQGHYALDKPSTNQVDETISAFEKLGLKVMITELDVNVLPSPAKHAMSADISTRFTMSAGLDPYTNGLPDSVQQQLAQRYADLFSVFLKHHSLSRVTFWGVTDGNSWLNDWPVHGRTSYPLLFNRDGKPKPAFDAVIQTAKANSDVKEEKTASLSGPSETESPASLPR